MSKRRPSIIPKTHQYELAKIRFELFYKSNPVLLLFLSEVTVHKLLCAAIAAATIGMEACAGSSIPSSSTSMFAAQNSSVAPFTKKRPYVSGAESIVYSFPNSNNQGLGPIGALASGDSGDFYGTTSYTNNFQCMSYYTPCGVVYHISPGTPWTQEIIHQFGFSDGSWPNTGIARNQNGALFGTTLYGGNGLCYAGDENFGCGVIYKLVKSGASWNETLLHQFQNGSDGLYPTGPLLIKNATLYGMTAGSVPACNSSGTCGTIFKIGIDGSGYTVLHRFGNVAYVPTGPLVADSSGALYGTTVFGGNGSCDVTVGCGIVFKINTDGSNYSVVHNFTGTNGNDGASPESGVVISNGVLYGTATSGGRNECAQEGNNPLGCGVIFSLTPSGSNYVESILYQFGPGPKSNSRIPSGLVVDSAGTLYGTTFGGGSGSNCPAVLFPYGCGEIFSYNGTFSILHFFQGPPDGANPYGGAAPSVAPALIQPNDVASSAITGSASSLLPDATGIIWGPTFAGGTGSCAIGCGAVFSVGGTGFDVRSHRKPQGTQTKRKRPF